MLRFLDFKSRHATSFHHWAYKFHFYHHPRFYFTENNATSNTCHFVFTWLCYTIYQSVEPDLSRTLAGLHSTICHFFQYENFGDDVSLILQWLSSGCTDLYRIPISTWMKHCQKFLMWFILEETTDYSVESDVNIKIISLMMNLIR